MESNIFFVAVSIAGIVLIAYLIWLDNRNLRMLKLRVKKMHASPMFAELAPLLKAAQSRPIEQLIIDKTGVSIRYMQPAGMETNFNMYGRGYRNLTPEKQEALLILLEEFLPRITDSNRYSLRKKRNKLLNGQYETYYQYTILNHYKTSLVRAPYYDGSLQHLW